jgi:hypothetical protein
MKTELGKFTFDQSLFSAPGRVKLAEQTWKITSLM